MMKGVISFLSWLFLDSPRVRVFLDDQNFCHQHDRALCKKQFEQRARNMTAKDATPSAPTGDGSTLSPEAKDKRTVKRAKEEVLGDLVSDGIDAFTVHHPSLGPNFLPIAGPFDDSEGATDGNNEWCHNKTLQPHF